MIFSFVEKFFKVTAFRNDTKKENYKMPCILIIFKPFTRKLNMVMMKPAGLLA